MALAENEQNALEFSLSCGRWADYPANLVYPSEFEHELDSYRNSLNDPKMSLFHSNPRMRFLRMWSLEKHGQGESAS